MQKLAKRLSVIMAVVMTLSLCLTFAPTANQASAATLYPQVQYAQEPQLEYTVGDRVSFNLYTPNYGGRVQYRVVLWNDETKSYKDLWNTPDRYYDKWMPYGNNIFTLGWVINEPGHYRITIYAKRAGITNNDCYLKGFNCDSYMESDSFVVKAKEVVKTPETVIPATSLALAEKSKQMVVGQEYEVKAKVDKAGVKVLFMVDAAADSMNKDLTGEAVSDASGIATFKYTRQFADADFITAYSAAAPAVRDVQKVYWGIKPILTIEAIGDNDKVTNGATKEYKVSLKNPVTGEPMRYKELKVMLKENIDSDELKSTAILTNDFNGEKVTPYQRKFNITNGGLNEVSLSLVTNDNGEASFKVTGFNVDATPIVYFDAFQFYNEMPVIHWPPALMYLYETIMNRDFSDLEDIDLGDVASATTTRFNNDFIYHDAAWWNTQLAAPVVLPDSGAAFASYAGDNDKRLDPVELQAEGKKVTFVVVPYTFSSTMDGGKYVAVYDMDARAQLEEDNENLIKHPKQYTDENISDFYDDWTDIVTGRTYTVTVKKPDGKLFVNGRVFVRIEELFDNKLTSHCDARIIAEDDDGLPVLVDTAVMYTNSDGEVEFTVVSPTKNDMATPRVWIDQDTPTYEGRVSVRDARYTEGEPTAVLDKIYFVNEAVDSADFEAGFKNANIDDANTDADDNFINLAGEWTTFTTTVYDQNNKVYLPEYGQILLTYTLTNNGRSNIIIKKPAQLEGVKIDRHPMLSNYEIEPGDTITLTGTYTDNWLENNDNDPIVVLEARTKDKTLASELKIEVQASTTVADDRIWWLPTNTTNANLGTSSLTAFWVKYAEIPDDYDDAVINVEGTIEFINTTEDYVVIKSGTKYYMVHYVYGDGNEATIYDDDDHENLMSIEEFEEVLDLDDTLDVYKSKNGDAFEIRYVWDDDK